MTPEQKAKSYDKALEKAKKLYEQGTITESLSYVFPELKESEDERIRKEICKILWDNAPYEEAQEYINYICRKQASTNSKDYEEMKETCIFYLNKQKCYVNDVSCIEKCIAWLEKQGEQNLVNETDEEIVEAVKDTSVLDLVEPKFKVGNWYQCTKDFFGKGVTFDKNTAYYCAKEGCLQCEYGCHIAIVKDLYDNFKLWTIKDAKDCDVLAVENMIFVYKGVLASHIVSYCKLFNNKFECFGDVRTCCAGNSKVHPATKEQRETLLKAMADAGYAFDFEKKELKKIEQNPAEWSEEDEMIALSIEQVMNCASLLNIVPEKIDKIRTWLKSLKDRYTWKPSEEQIIALDEVYKTHGANSACRRILLKLLNDLKKL